MRFLLIVLVSALLMPICCGCGGGGARQPELIAYGGDGLWLMETDGTNPRQLGFQGNDGILAFSPDGHEIAFVRQGGPASGIYKISVDGTNETYLGPKGSGVGLAWGRGY